MKSLHKLWESRAPRERTILTLLAAALAIALWTSLFTSAVRARDELHARVATLHGKMAQLEKQAAEYERLRARVPLAASRTDLGVIVRARAGAPSMSGSVVQVDASNADRVNVILGSVRFADWLDWIAELKSQRVNVESCRIEALATPGLVSITATLSRAPR